MLITFARYGYDRHKHAEEVWKTQNKTQPAFLSKGVTPSLHLTAKMGEQEEDTTTAEFVL